MLAVDDARLLDAASAETPVQLRGAPPGRRPHRDAVDRFLGVTAADAVLANAGLPTMQLYGIDLAAARTLIARTADGQPNAGITAKLHEATAGDPLGLLELSRDLERVARMPRLPVPETVAQAFAQRISALTQVAQRALLIAAVADGDLTVTSRPQLPLGIRVDELAAAEAVERLLERDPRQALFRHPLVRSAVPGSQPDWRARPAGRSPTRCRKAHRTGAPGT